MQSLRRVVLTCGNEATATARVAAVIDLAVIYCALNINVWKQKYLSETYHFNGGRYKK